MVLNVLAVSRSWYLLKYLTLFYLSHHNFVFTKCYLLKSSLLSAHPVGACLHQCVSLPKVVELFSNVTWTKEEHTVHEFELVDNWRTPWTGIFVNLLLYITFTVSPAAMPTQTLLCDTLSCVIHTVYVQYS